MLTPAQRELIRFLARQVVRDYRSAEPRSDSVTSLSESTGAGGDRVDRGDPSHQLRAQRPEPPPAHVMTDNAELRGEE